MADAQDDPDVVAREYADETGLSARISIWSRRTGGEFDAAVANFMLYHVPDLDGALAELARVVRAGGRLVAATNGVDQLRELWELVGRDTTERRRLFMRETGTEHLERHFARVRMIDLPATVELSAEDMRFYVSHSVRYKYAADRIPDFEGTRTVSASTAVFVADR